MRNRLARLVAFAAYALLIGCDAESGRGPTAPATGESPPPPAAGAAATQPGSSMQAPPSSAMMPVEQPAAMKPAQQPAAIPAAMMPPAMQQPSAARSTTPAPSPEGFLQSVGDGWQALIIGEWELPPGKEGYRCQRFTMPRDVSVGAFRGLNPPGTHHTQVWVANESDQSPDGFSECKSDTISTLSVAGSGPGANDLTFPPGVAVTLRAGQQLLLNLHLFNVSDKPLRGISGTLIKQLDEADVRHEAELFLPGTATLSIPPGGPTTQSGECTLTQDTTLFALTPHMHQLGVHMKAVAKSSIMGDVVMSDRPYSFDAQLFYMLEPPIQMKAGDKIRVECTYMNTTAATVGYGDSSLKEMCFASTYRYPAVGKPVCIR